MLTPYVGTVYDFVFVSPFSIYNGIYKVLRILTYDEIISDNIDISTIYIETGQTEEDYNTAVTEYLRTDKFLKLEKINDKSILYIPYSLTELEPDPNVKKYSRLAIAVDLGIFDNINDIQFAKNTIESMIDKGLGVGESTHAFSIEEVWLTLEDYNEEVKKREERKQGLINLYSEVLRLRQELDNQNTKIKYYEDLIIKLNSST